MYLMYLASLGPCPFFLVYSLSFLFFDGKILCNVVYFPLFLLLPTHFYLPPPVLFSPTSHTPLVPYFPLTQALTALFFPTSCNQLHEGSRHCNFVDWKWCFSDCKTFMFLPPMSELYGFQEGTCIQREQGVLKLEKVFFMMIMIIFLLFIGDTGNSGLTYTEFYPLYTAVYYSEITLLWLPFFVLFFFSGGKDSCYNMMQCVKHGHVIVALANLKPSNGGRDIFINVIGCTIAFFWKMGRFSKDNTTSVMEKYVEKTERDFQCLICHCTILGSSWFRSAHSIVTVIT